jgi:hypothetical protein
VVKGLAPEAEPILVVPARPAIDLITVCLVRVAIVRATSADQGHPAIVRATSVGLVHLEIVLAISVAPERRAIVLVISAGPADPTSGIPVAPISGNRVVPT